jgi:hypothetical protein
MSDKPEHATVGKKFEHTIEKLEKVRGLSFIFEIGLFFYFSLV